MEFLTDYGLFLAKAVTIVAAVLVVIIALVSVTQRSRHRHQDGEIRVERLNDKFDSMKKAVQHKMLAAHERKAWLKRQKKDEKQKRKSAKSSENASDQDLRPRVFVLDFNGDIKASDTRSLRQCISAVLAVARPDTDRVVVKLESGGGLVHAYGLAAAQLDRIRQAKLPLTACVDKVAASGGYMMACVADRIVASPFAVVGSIGVVAQLPNFHRLLKKHDVDYEVLTAGEHKRTLTVFGENTEKGREKFLDDLQDTHTLFKQYVAERRPAVAIDEVATGDIWFGQRALEVSLVDELMTSDQYLIEACAAADVYKVSYERHHSLSEKIGIGVSAGAEKLFLGMAELVRGGRFGG
ncbi:protease SohB [Hydrocarboniclastica marina]|uniref:Protease SohB n=1 Tax=Hydrocarboniclastica marina TaxID=2259620 RepID=A0A4P7XGN8_9ALTE|nr:protease SohB [Hydrocarboniclastica marina]QCF26178.1 protease SohB [Hydrocarboniclastica marina]